MRVLLAQHHPKNTSILLQILSADGYAIDCVYSTSDLQFALTSHQYDVAIIDMSLPGHDSIELIQTLRRAQITCPILMLACKDCVHSRVSALNAGADDVISKPFVVSELKARIKALIRRTHCQGQIELQCGEIRFNVATRRVYLQNKPVELSAKEMNILEVLLMNSNHILTKQQIIEHLYGWDESVSWNAIEVYIHRLRKKLTTNGAKLKTIRGLGYLLESSA